MRGASNPLSTNPDRYNALIVFIYDDSMQRSTTRHDNQCTPPGQEHTRRDRGEPGLLNCHVPKSKTVSSRSDDEIDGVRSIWRASKRKSLYSDEQSVGASFDAGRHAQAGSNRRRKQDRGCTVHRLQDDDLRRASALCLERAVAVRLGM